MSDESEPPLSYASFFLDCSRERLHDFHLKQQGKSANMRKALAKDLNEFIEERALELFTNWFMEHGEQLIMLAAESLSKSPEEEPKPNALPVAEPKRTYDFWRVDGRRFNSRRRSG